MQGFTRDYKGIEGISRYTKITGVYVGLQGLYRGMEIRFTWVHKDYRGYTRVYKGLQYTCQLFLRYMREIFILGVLGFLKTA